MLGSGQQSRGVCRDEKDSPRFRNRKEMRTGYVLNVEGPERKSFRS